MCGATNLATRRRAANLATSGRAANGLVGGSASRLATAKIRGASCGGLGAFLGLVRGATNHSTRGASSGLVRWAANGPNNGLGAFLGLVGRSTSGLTATKLRGGSSGLVMRGATDGTNEGLGAFLGLVVRGGDRGLFRRLRGRGMMMMLPPLVMPPRLAVSGDEKTQLMGGTKRETSHD